MESKYSLPVRIMVRPLPHLRWRLPGGSSKQHAPKRGLLTSDFCHCMDQPWLTISDCPVRALDSNEAKKSAASATSSTVVNSPSTVSFNMTSRITDSGE